MRIDIDRIEREDLVRFVNAALACTGQSEFYADRGATAPSIDFLHAYVMGNYRRLYARTLAVGINHFNQAEVLFRLLAAGAPADAADRAEENALIGAALRRLPPQRVYRLFRRLAAARVSNRRTRATLRGWLASRRDLAFDALKYRPGLRAAARHAHLPALGEVGDFLFGGHGDHRTWETPLLETHRQARYSQRALFELPMTVAEGLAAQHGLSRDVFLRRIEARMTAAERLRVEQSAQRHDARLSALDLARQPLTRLCSYLLSRPAEERSEARTALAAAAHRALRQAPAVKLGRVAAVLDRSWSSSGSDEKRRRPLAVALGVSALLRAGAEAYRAFWTAPACDDLSVYPRGQTDLATPLVEALAWRPDLVVIVSDGYENAPPGAAAEVARVFRARLDPGGRTTIVCFNPVFDPEDYQPRPLGAAIPTIGIRDAEDLPALLGFARFAGDDGRLADLEAHLARCAARLIQWAEDHAAAEEEA